VTEAELCLELLLLERGEIILCFDLQQQGVMDDEIESRGCLDVVATVVEVQQLSALEVELEITQLNGDALFLGLTREAGSECAVNIHAGTDDKVGKVGFVHGVGLRSGGESSVVELFHNIRQKHVAKQSMHAFIALHFPKWLGSSVGRAWD